MTTESGELLEQTTHALTTSPIQLDLTARVNASPETVFDFAADHNRLPEWAPGVKSVEVDNSDAEQPGEVGAVRYLSGAFGKPDKEVVRAFDRPRLLSISNSDESLHGMFTDHIGIIVFESEGDGTRLRLRICAVPGRNPIARFIGKRLLPIMMGRARRNLQQHFTA